MKANITISPDEIGRIVAVHNAALGLPVVGVLTFNLDAYTLTNLSFDVEMPEAAPKKRKKVEKKR